MAFKLGNRMIEKVLFGYAETLDTENSKLLYTLDQLTDTNINITAEANEHKDADGNLVKKSYKNKAGTLEAKNAFVNTNIIAAAAGDDVTYGETSAFTAPKIVIVPAGTKEYVYKGKDTVVEGSVRVSGVDSGVQYTVSESATADKFAVDKTNGKITLPTATDTGFVIRYDRTVETGALIVNSSDKFPKSCRLILKVAYWDTCDKDTLKGCYVVLPSFQVSPEISIPLNAETQMDYKGDLETDYCGGEKVLYKFFDVADDEE